MDSSEKPRHEGLEALGVSADLNKDLYQYDKPNAKLLERFPCPKGSSNLTLRIDCPEFTSLCPMTGQPDFATIVIIYTPDEWCVESKALKLYLMGFRNHGDFHEACTQRICDDLVNLLSPNALRVEGQFTARGGISVQPVAIFQKDGQK